MNHMYEPNVPSREGAVNSHSDTEPRSPIPIHAENPPEIRGGGSSVIPAGFEPALPP
jgi:hypothetical protein